LEPLASGYAQSLKRRDDISHIRELYVTEHSRKPWGSGHHDERPDTF
jgi:hypothetical protein